jgi:hypothetical protein
MVRPEYGRKAMHAVVRNWTGAGGRELADVLEKRGEGIVRELIATIDGFDAFTCIRTPEGCMTVTICRDKAATEEATRRAREWTSKNIAKVGLPMITTGEVLIKI